MAGKLVTRQRFPNQKPKGGEGFVRKPRVGFCIPDRFSAHVFIFVRQSKPSHVPSKSLSGNQVSYEPSVPSIRNLNSKAGRAEV